VPADASRAETIGAALISASGELSRAGVPDARLEAEWLLARLLDTDRGGLFVRRQEPLDSSVHATYREWTELRARRVPVQQITGVQEFHGLEFRVDRHVLIPRPETEGIVDAALSLDMPPGATVVDLGTGSGCIAITLAVRCPDLAIIAVDRSPQALVVARDNARLHQVEQRVRFVRGDLRSTPDAWRGSIDLVVSNPPYVSEAEWHRLEPEVRDHDPREALVAGSTGLEAYEMLVPTASTILRPGGNLILELGHGQADAVSTRVGGAGLEVVEIRPDLNGIPRVLVARSA
jgi:release factor glutamine methyltransferase